MKVLIISNSSWNLYNFRFNLVKELLKKKYKVCIIAKDEKYSDIFINMGCKFYNVNIRRKTINLFRNLIIFIKFLFLIARIKPNTILSFSLKPNIYGGLISRLLIINHISTVTGLGTFYLHNKILKKFIILLYKISLKKNKKIIFHNIDDLNYFNNLKIVNNNGVIVSGSGVDLKKFYFKPLIKERKKIYITMISRLIFDKGVREYVLASQMVLKQKKNVIFNLIGDIDYDNKSSISKEELNMWIEKKYINYYGFSENINKYIYESDCIVLPSYREGLSKILIESCAMGRPIITTDVPGCKEVVKENYNGYLCKPKNAKDLFLKLLLFINLSIQKKNELSKNSSKLAILEFDEKKVIDAYINSI